MSDVGQVPFPDWWWLRQSVGVQTAAATTFVVSTLDQTTQVLCALFGEEDFAVEAPKVA